MHMQMQNLGQIGDSREKNGCHAVHCPLQYIKIEIEPHHTEESLLMLYVNIKGAVWSTPLSLFAA